MFSLLLLYAYYNNKPFFVVIFKGSFIIHLCCQIIYSVRETNHFQNTKMPYHLNTYCPVTWGCRIHQLLLCKGVRPHHHQQQVSWIYDTKQSDVEVLVMLVLWWMQGILSLPLLPGSLWPRLVAPDRVLSMSQIELNCVLMLNWIVWNRTVLTFNCL